MLAFGDVEHDFVKGVYRLKPTLKGGGRRLILKLQEDWAYREEYKEAAERLEGLAWVT
jgi:hypothetical protein